jgi:hypothetical protein
MAAAGGRADAHASVDAEQIAQIVTEETGRAHPQHRR